MDRRKFIKIATAAAIGASLPESPVPTAAVTPINYEDFMRFYLERMMKQRHLELLNGLSYAYFRDGDAVWYCRRDKVPVSELRKIYP